MVCSGGSAAKENRGAGRKRDSRSKKALEGGRGGHGGPGSGSRQGEAANHNKKNKKPKGNNGTALKHDAGRDAPSTSQLRAKGPSASGHHHQQRKEKSPQPHPLPSLPGSGGKFSGVNVLLLVSGAYKTPGVKRHTALVPAKGGAVTVDKDSKPLTHAVFEGSLDALKARIGGPTLELWISRGVKVVRPSWLIDNLKQPNSPLLPTDGHEMLLQPPAAQQAQEPPGAAAPPPGGAPPPQGAAAAAARDAHQMNPDLAKWLRWFGLEAFDNPEAFAARPKIGKLLQGRFDVGKCEALGNLPLLKALKEILKYENAVMPPGSDGHEATVLREAAAMVCCCGFRIEPRHVTEEVIPAFMQASTLSLVLEILETGTCSKLESFRRNAAVPNSKKMMRQNVTGAHSRMLFQKLPGVGHALAKEWFELGLRTFEDVAREASGPGGCLYDAGEKAAARARAKGLSHLPAEAVRLHSAQHHGDFATAVSGDDCREMEAALRGALEDAAGNLELDRSKWRVEMAGGGRRGKASHDADFLVSHCAGGAMEGVMDIVVNYLESKGLVLCQDEAFHQVQTGKWRSRHEGGGKLKGEGALDDYDHLFGVFRTAAGRLCRMDIILVPLEQWAFGLLGWTGSASWLRMAKQHARNRNMALTAHGLFRKVDGAFLRVPTEVPPSDCNGGDWWPPGWSSTRRVESEEDIFELLGLEYRPPRERNC